MSRDNDYDADYSGIDPDVLFDPRDPDKNDRDVSNATWNSQRSKTGDESTGSKLVLDNSPRSTFDESSRFNFEDSSYTNDKEFVPRPYLFVSSGTEVMPETTSRARMPPYWLLVDHTFAIIFCMCSPKFKERPPLGLSQLSWALELLRSVKSRRGTYNKDVKVLMGAIEDRILECYVAIGKTTEANESQASKDESKATPAKHRPQPSARPPRQNQQPVTSTPIKAPALGRTSSPKDVTDVVEEKNRTRQDLPSSPRDERKFHRFEAGLSKPAVPRNKVAQDKTQKVNYAPNQGATTTTPAGGHRVVSVTYEEVVARAPAVHEAPTQRHAGMRPRRLFQDDNPEGGPGQLQTNRVGSRATTQKIVSDNLVSFLVNWRQEQVERLQVEMQRLDNIEQFMSKINDNHERVLDEDMARQLREVQLQPRQPGSSPADRGKNRTF